jgi:hypothetical protein
LNHLSRLKKQWLFDQSTYKVNFNFFYIIYKMDKESSSGILGGASRSSLIGWIIAIIIILTSLIVVVASDNKMVEVMAAVVLLVSAGITGAVLVPSMFSAVDTYKTRLSPYAYAPT